MVDPYPYAADLGARVSRIEERLDDALTRLEALEGARPRPHAVATPAAVEDEAPGAEAPGEARGPAIPVLVGRTCVVLGGAFLLRSLTESGTVSQALGVALGLVYAALWVLMAARAARAGGKGDAAFHGLAASAIAYPLLFETTVRFGVLPPVVAAGLVLAFATGLLALAWRFHLRALAWVGASGALLTAGLLLLRTDAVLPCAAVLLALLLASVGVSYGRSWTPLRWVVGLVADALAVGLTVRALSGAAPEGAAGALALLLVVSGTWFGACAWRALVRRVRVGGFEIAQCVFAVVAAFEGAPRVAALLGPVGLGPAIGASALAAAALGILALRWRTDPPVNVAATAALAALLLVEGLPALVGSGPAALAWCAVALAAAWVGREAGPALRALAAALVVAACVASGLALWTARALGFGEGARWGAMPAAALAVTAAAVALYLILRWRTAERDAASWLAPALAAALVAAYGLAATVVLALGPAVAGVPGAERDAAALAALRTAALTALIWALAWAGRTRRRELRWAALATLAYAVFKALLEDLLRGRAATLFLTFVLLGSTLMALPLLTRRAAPAPTGPRPADQ